MFKNTNKRSESILLVPHRCISAVKDLVLLILIRTELLPEQFGLKHILNLKGNLKNITFKNRSKPFFLFLL